MRVTCHAHRSPGDCPSFRGHGARWVSMASPETSGCQPEGRNETVVCLGAPVTSVLGFLAGMCQVMAAMNVSEGPHYVPLRTVLEHAQTSAERVMAHQRARRP